VEAGLLHEAGQRRLHGGRSREITSRVDRRGERTGAAELCDRNVLALWVQQAAQDYRQALARLTGEVCHARQKTDM
jgi:hypothetical protein